MNTTDLYASNLEKKLIDEFKQKFKDKLGYKPIVITKVFIDDNFCVALMSLDELKKFFDPFYVMEYGKKLDIFSKSRKREIVELRMMFFYIARQMKYTYTSIGEYVNNKHHTTVLHNLTTFRNLIETSDVFKLRYKQIINHIKENYESSNLDKFNEIQFESEPDILS
jgi:hypothetical protein